MDSLSISDTVFREVRELHKELHSRSPIPFQHLASMFNLTMPLTGHCLCGSEALTSLELPLYTHYSNTMYHTRHPTEFEGATR